MSNDVRLTPAMCRDDFRKWRRQARDTRSQFTLLFAGILNRMRTLQTTDMVVLTCLGLHAGRNSGETWVGNRRLSLSLGYSTRTMQRSFDRLERAGLLQRLRFTPQGVNRKFLRPYPLWASADGDDIRQETDARLKTAGMDTPELRALADRLRREYAQWRRTSRTENPPNLVLYRGFLDFMPKLGSTDMAVYAVLGLKATGDGEYAHGPEHIGAAANLSQRTVQRALARLMQLGLVARLLDAGRVTLYLRPYPLLPSEAGAEKGTCEGS